jgi:peptide/nickel transport system ATP-binding protein
VRSPDILAADAVSKTFPARRRTVLAVDRVSFALSGGRVLGIVGESGSGKSTLANLLVRAERPSAGRILFHGKDIAELDGAGARAFRRSVQMIFQDPFASLDPRFTVARTVGEPLVIHRIGDGAGRRRRVIDALEAAELKPGAAFLDRLPQQLSGGQRQRVAIARALVLDPEILIADEPVSMLDVSARAGVLDLLRTLVRERGLGMAFVTHDLSLIGSICSEVAVIYQGRFVETGPPAALLSAPLHPYTRALIAAIPVPDPTAERRDSAISREPREAAAGCAYAPRCPHAAAPCDLQPPPLAAAGTGRAAACARLAEIDCVR